MSRKTSAARREAFFAALAETGNQTIAAERAKVSRSWVSLHRAEEPGFRARMEAAIAEAGARLRAARSVGPARKWGHLNGEELAVRGSNGRRTQIARARLKQWTPRVEARFLQTLSATANVKAARAAVGMTAPGAYAHRNRWPRFATLWDEAVETGFARIQMALVANAGNFLAPGELPPEIDMPGMTVGQAIHILHMGMFKVHGVGKRPGRWRRPRTLDEVRDSILGKLEAIETARREDAEEVARHGADYARLRWRADEAAAEGEEAGGGEAVEGEAAGGG